MPETTKYMDFAEKLYESCIITDAWIEGRARFTLEPVIISDKKYNLLKSASEEIGFLYEELCKIIWTKPELIDYFHLTPYQKLLWFTSGGLWHGISRLDMFIIDDGSIKMCEMNSDTPSGEAETVLINELFEDDFKEHINPNKEFKSHFMNMIDRFSQDVKADKSKLTVGIVYPTEMTEDLSMIKLYEKWLLEKDFDVITGSPFNLYMTDNKLFLFNRQIDIIIRHYKSDWWTERESPWINFEFTDSKPLKNELNAILTSYLNKSVNIINPFGSVITQNKFSLSFFYDYFNLFNPEFQRIITSFIPETRRMQDIDYKEINKDDWVLKSDYGCEGEEVLIGKNVTQDEWNEYLNEIVFEHWIAQKYFQIARYKDIYYPNYGIFLITGKACGIFTRLSETSTDYKSVAAPTFIKKF